MTSLNCWQANGKEDPYIRIKNIFYNYFPDVELQDVMKNGNFTFPICLTNKQREQDLYKMDIELTIRSYNALRRVGIHTVGELCDSIEKSSDLARIRGLGKKTQKNIMCSLFMYQYNCLNSSQRKAYLKEVINLSIGGA